MSNSYYNQKWEQAIGDLLQQVDEENMPLEENKNEKGLTYKRTDLEWFQYYAGLYVKYIDVYRRLEDCYDQLVHPQKRLLLREMLDNAMVRMCEVKENLVRYSTASNIIQSDFIHLDDIVMDLKLTPKVLEVPVPRYFREDRRQKIQERDQMMLQFMEDYRGTTQPEEEVIDDNCALDTNQETAVRIIQKLERGRQGIMRLLEMQKLKNKLLKQKNNRINQISGDEEESQRAAIIQKYWRAFASRRIIHEMRQEQMKFLGMEKEPIKDSVQEIATKQRTRLKLLQIDNENTFKMDQAKLKKEVYFTQEYNIRSTLLDERRKWIQKFLQMNEFGDLPKTIEQYYEKDKVEEDKENQKPGKKKDQGKDQNKGKPKKNEVQKFLEEHNQHGPSELVLKLQKNIEEHTVKWAPRDESDNLQQKYDTDMARNGIRPEVEEEIRVRVDDMLSLQLDNMRIKYGLKKKKEKKKKAKKKKEKKVKIPLGLGKKNPKELLAELVENNVAKILQPAKIADLIGQHNPLGSALEKQAMTMPDPSIAQLRQVLVESIAIPLGSAIAKDRLEKNSWFLFYGPMGSGKTLAVRALQTECNAIVFDLTPSNLQEKYDKNSLKRLIWTVIICAKEFQPAIVLIDDFEMIFPGGGKKKKKDSGAAAAARMKKPIIMLKKKNKLWAKNDQIAVIACTNKPYEANVKEVKKIFDKKFYFPYPNYATRKLMFCTMVEKKMGRLPDGFHFNTIAHVTEGFTGGSFKICIEKVLTEARIKRIFDDGLRLSEFIFPLSNTYCTYAHEYEKIKEFTDEVTGLKERRLKKLNPTEDNKKTAKPTKK